MKPKFRAVIKATNRNSGYVLEGEELTVQMQKYVLANQDQFEVILEDEATAQAKEVEEAKASDPEPDPGQAPEESEAEPEVGIEEAGVDPTRFSKSQLRSFDKNGLLLTARELGLMVESTMTKDEIIDEILGFQDAPA